jgi:hypothetical protein
MKAKNLGKMMSWVICRGRDAVQRLSLHTLNIMKLIETIEVQTRTREMSPAYFTFVTPNQPPAPALLRGQWRRLLLTDHTQAGFVLLVRPQGELLM